MNYSIMNDEDIIKDLAEHVEKLRIAHRIKETEIEESAGISRKTLYNFKKGATGISLKNYIRLLRALGEVERLQLMFPEDASYSPRNTEEADMPKRVRDRRAGERDFQWGDES